MSKHSPTDRECFDVALRDLARIEARKPAKASTADVMDQTWVDGREEQLGRVVYYAALVVGLTRDEAKIYSDKPTSPEATEIVERARSVR